MIGNSLLTQIIVAIISIGIIITYIQPTLTQINSRQSEIGQTKDELERVNEVNNRLNQLVEQTNSISPRDKQALTTYMPSNIDTVQVLKDISTMALAAEVTNTALTYTGEDEVVSIEENKQSLLIHTFDLNIEAAYNQLKDLLLRFEQNNYPLEIVSLKVSPAKSGKLGANLVIETYSNQ